MISFLNPSYSIGKQKQDLLISRFEVIPDMNDVGMIQSLEDMDLIHYLIVILHESFVDDSMTVSDSFFSSFVCPNSATFHSYQESQASFPPFHQGRSRPKLFHELTSKQHPSSPHLEVSTSPSIPSQTLLFPTTLLSDIPSSS